MKTAKVRWIATKRRVKAKFLRSYGRIGTAITIKWPGNGVMCIGRIYMYYPSGKERQFEYYKIAYTADKIREHIDLPTTRRLQDFTFELAAPVGSMRHLMEKAGYINLLPSENRHKKTNKFVLIMVVMHTGHNTNNGRRVITNYEEGTLCHVFWI